MNKLFEWDGTCLITGYIFRANDVHNREAKKAAKKLKAKTKKNETTTTT